MKNYYLYLYIYINYNVFLDHWGIPRKFSIYTFIGKISHIA